MRRLLTLAAVLIVMGSGGCFELDLPPAGSYSELVLVTDGGAQSPYATQILPWISYELDYMVSQEPQFNIRFADAADLPDVPLVKNILICGVAQPTTDIGDFIVTHLGQATMERVLSGQANVFRKEDLPGQGQTTVIITAANGPDLERIIRQRGREIPEIIEESNRERVRNFLLKRANENLSKRLYRDYGFRIQMPTIYRLFSEEKQPPGVEFMRNAPSRSLGIFWLDWDGPLTLQHRQELFDYRNSYVNVRYNGDEMDSTRVSFSSAMLGEYPAVKMEGYWSNANSIAGGYYQTYFLYDERMDLVWALDLLVYAPGMPKHPHFRELHALAETFRMP